MATTKQRAAKLKKRREHQTRAGTPRSNPHSFHTQKTKRRLMQDPERFRAAHEFDLVSTSEHKAEMTRLMAEQARQAGINTVVTIERNPTEAEWEEILAAAKRSKKSVVKVAESRGFTMTAEGAIKQDRAALRNRFNYSIVEQDEAA